MASKQGKVEEDGQGQLKRRRFLRSIGIAAAATAGAGAVGAESLAAAESDRQVVGSGLDPFVGEIALFAFSFTPTGWVPCDGRLLLISQYQALFSLLGTIYGGDGMTTFAVPNLNGRFPLGRNGTHSQGQVGGAESVTLTANEMPAHTHAVAASSAQANQRGPGGNVWAQEAMGQDAVYGSDAPNVSMSPSAITSTGQSQAHQNMPPYLALNFCIAVEGIYPSRD